MQPRVFLAIVALIVGLFAPIGVAWMTTKQTEAGAASPISLGPRKGSRLDDLFVDDPVVCRPIPQGTWIKNPEDWFEMRLLPRSSVPKNAVTRLDQIKDRVASKNFAKGSAVDSEDLLRKEGVGLFIGLPGGKRALTIKVSRADCLAFHPGSLVRVENTVKSDSSEDEYSQIILENMLILATEPVDDMQRGESLGPRSDTVTLLVTVEEAQVLSLAQKIGALRLLPTKQEPNAGAQGLND